MSQKSGVYSLD